MSTTAPADPAAVAEPGIVPGVFDTPDPAAPSEAPAPSEFDDVLQDMDHRVWVFEGTVHGIRGGQPFEDQIKLEYDQEPLSYTGIVHFWGLISRKLEEAMSGPDALGVSSVLEVAGMASSLEGADDETGVRAALANLIETGNLGGIDTFVRGLARLSAYVPEILDEAHCIWLRVPFRERMLVRELWSNTPGKGGLTGDEGEEMLRIFIHQNYEELERFFGQRLRRIFAQAQKERKRIHPDA